MRLCTSGAWGKGIYFAEASDYSNGYAHAPNSYASVK